MKKSAQLTNKQLEKSISVKQSKVKLKNVLASPYTKYWPLLPSSSLPTLKNILKSVLAQRQSEAHSEGKKRTTVNRNFLLHGLCSVQRNLRAGKVDSLILSTSIEPRFVLNQIIQHAFAQKKNLKVLCVDKLEDLLKDAGIPSVSLALINQHEKNDFNPLHSFISQESERFPVPEDYICESRTKNDGKTERKKAKSLLSLDFQANSLYLRKHKYTKDRVFIPEVSNIEESCKMIEGTPEDSHSSSSEEEFRKPKQVAKSLTNLSISSKAIRKVKTKRPKKKSAAYLPLVINRILPNPSKQRSKKLKKKKAK
ncbi:uncharacterized protein LOC132256351 [Phlebotomus argentipes]|uniref:uncharacterized protein LOC132256351 n=1 Tax=Phlebotomus argentipes TaxID=94469 RepID=UPI00289368CD|nr:uncharacterized protein LOC132256351 [Phlebotomus argentipes]